MRIKNRKIIILGAAAFIAFIFIVDKSVLSVFRQKLSSVNREITLMEETLKNALLLQSQSGHIKKAYNEYLSYIDISGDDRNIIASFLREIEKITHASKISLANLNPENEPIKDEYSKRFKADLRFEAQAEQLFDFLKRIQESPLLIRVERLSLTARDELAAALRVEVTLSMSLPAL
jgi:hypothetical protein